MNFHSYNRFHLGDNLLHLHFLRHLALAYPQHTFVHALKESYLAALGECVEDVMNVALIPLEEMARFPDVHWINAWKNAGCQMAPDAPFAPGFWDTHPDRNDFSRFYLELFGILARRMGLESPFHVPADLWFDYPKIRHGKGAEKLLNDIGAAANRAGEPAFDFLVVNSVPLSGQLRAFRGDPNHLSPLIEELARSYRVAVTSPMERSGDPSNAPPIWCTHDYGLSLTDIGTLSLHCPYLLMVSTGPSWPTFNVWNRDTVKLRVVMVDTEQLNLGGNTIQATTRDVARGILVDHGLLPTTAPSALPLTEWATS